MATFEEALAGMRKGEKWRRPAWHSDVYITIHQLQLQYNSLENDSLLASDWEKVTDCRTFKQAFSRALKGYAQRRASRKYTVRAERYCAGRVTFTALSLDDIDATDWEDA